MIDLPEIKEGSGWQDYSSRQWRNLVETVRSLANLQAGTGIGMRRHGGQLGIEAVVRPESRPIPTHHVVILDAHHELLIEGAQEGYRTLLVRGICHSPLPPKAGQYVWATEPFVAFPEVGTDFDAFESYVYTDPEPWGDVQALLAVYRGEYWYVSPPASAKRLVILRDFTDEASIYVTVQEVAPKYPPEGPWDGTYGVVGEPVVVNVWPGLKAGDYRIWRWEAEQPTDRTTILPLEMIGGVWYLVQQPKWPVVRRTGAVRFLDCTRAYTESTQ